MAVATAKKTRTANPARSTISTPRAQEYYGRIAKRHMTPLWKVMNSVVTKEPKSRAQADRLALQ